jgi:GDP-mannose 6-dehydrogenase
LIETLVGRGFQVQVYDDTVRPDKLVGANRTYIERSLPHIMTLMNNSFEEVVATSEVLVIANGSQRFKEVLAMCGPQQKVIDLVGIAKTDSPRACQYEGICW